MGKLLRVNVRERVWSERWDLVIIDEAHKMSASFFRGEVRETDSDVIEHPPPRIPLRACSIERPACGCSRDRFVDS